MFHMFNLYMLTDVVIYIVFVFIFLFSFLLLESRETLKISNLVKTLSFVRGTTSSLILNAY